MKDGRITVVIADDHASVRAGIRLLLETAEDVEVLGEASDGAAAVERVAALEPDIVLMDARMPGMDGIAATRRIVGRTRTDVVMLTTFDLDEVVFGALRAGAVGFLLKSADPGELLAAIRKVAAGEGTVSSEVTRKMLRHFIGPAASRDPGGPAAFHRPGESATSQRLGGGASSGVARPGSGPEAGPFSDLESRSWRDAGDAGGRGPAGRAGAERDLTPRELEILRALSRGRSNAEIASELFITRATVKTHVSSVLAKLGLRSRVQAAMYAREAGIL
jgi:DNA-binding NarL/FixJ family response regulator